MKNIILGIATAQVTQTGLVEMKAMIHPSLVGPTDAQRKILLFVDPDTAKDVLGIDVGELPMKSKGDVKIDAGSLLAQCGGGYIKSGEFIQSIFDASGEKVIDRSVHDVNNIMYLLDREAGVKLGLIEDESDVDGKYVATIQGAAAEVVMGILNEGLSEELPRSDVIAFHLSEIFDTELDADVTLTSHDGAEVTASA